MQDTPAEKTTSADLKALKGQRKIVALTAYDFTFASLLDDLVDVILIGDSLGMVVQGKANTVSVRLDDVVYHSRAVSRAAKHAHLVADMPFMTYHAEPAEAIRNAGRLLSEGYAEAVKLEGGIEIAETVKRLVQIGIPVMGHVGLTPQKVHAYGGFKVQGRSPETHEAILRDALAVADAGVYAMVLECIPAELAQQITERVSAPTIGIGAGRHCDGQVVVGQDLLGMNPEFSPKFVKQYTHLADTIRQAVGAFARDVKSGEFPGSEHSF